MTDYGAPYSAEGSMVIGLTASAALTSYQYYLVKLSADNSCTVCAAATDVPIGVLQNAPASGATADVMICGVTKVAADEALAAGNIIGSGTDGQCQVVTTAETTVYTVGQVISGCGAAGDYATAAICCRPQRSA